MMDQDENPANVTRLVQQQACLPSATPKGAAPWSRTARLVACAVLAIAILVTFWPVLNAGFINFDDGEYVLENPHVNTGLTVPNIVWSFSAGYASNWHPLTWISHMLDVQLFGLSPSGHHAVNLLLHIVNSILLFWILLRLTSSEWPSLAVTALFALHPLHVESVAWVAERKDVLSTLFFLLTIWAYALYATGCVKLNAGSATTAAANLESAAGQQSHSARSAMWYPLSLLLFALGLMCKPMLVTLPFVLLLLDYWPLGRLGGITSRPDSPSGHESFRELSSSLPLVKEKIPFLLLAIASCVVTFVVQSQAKAVKLFLPLRMRLENATASYISYLFKTLWPSRLCVFYPHPNTRYNLPQADAAHPISEQWPLWAILVSAAGLLAASYLVFKWRKRAPWVFSGWFWYLGTLVPVIGVIQVGMQAMADRYTYIPLIGLFIAVVWSAVSCLSILQSTRPVAFGLAAVVIVAFGLISHNQAALWHDDITLFQHALNVTTNNAVAECHVGAGLANSGQFDAAEQKFKVALVDDPFFYFAHSSLGSLYELEGRTNQAIQQYQSTLRLRPWDEFAHLHLAGLFHKLGRDEDSMGEYKKNLQANPDSVTGNYELGALLLDRGELNDANRYLDKAVELKPDHVDALLCLADLRSRQGKLPAAEAALETVVQLYPTNAELRINLASLMWQAGHQDEALKQYIEAVRLRPAEPLGHFDLGIAYAGTGKYLEATKALEEAIRLKPSYPEAISELAWLLATNPHPDQRNGQRALALASQALQLGAADQVRTWAALDVAYAETGQFTEAVNAAQKAEDLAKRQGNAPLVQAAEQRLLLYKANKPFRLP